MKIFPLVIATAVAWPLNLAAQGLGSTVDGTRLGASDEKGSVSAPDAGDVLTLLPASAGSDGKTGEPGVLALPEPEIAEVPGTGADAQAAGVDPGTAEAGQANAPGPGPAEGAADSAVETAMIAPDPADVMPEPLPEIEIGADPVQIPIAPAAGADPALASAELGSGVSSDDDAPGEEFVLLSREDSAALPRPVSPELLEALAASVLTDPSAPEIVGADHSGFDLVMTAHPGEAEEARESDLAAFARMTGVSRAILEAASGTQLAMPDLAYADVDEEIVSREEKTVLAALADNPTAPFEEKSMTDPNEIACLDLLGPPNAGVPASQAAAAEARTRLAQAAPACEAAAEGPRVAPEVLYHAAEIALSKRDTTGSFALFERAAEAGVTAADTKLGDFYLFGAAPGGRDIAKAVERFERATGLGDPAAMTSLAMMHRAATGVPQDSVRMVELLRNAAEADYHFAQFRLAQTYLSGDGIPGRADAALGIPDAARAADWFTRAADAGNIEAALELAALYNNPASGLPDNPAEQARLTQMAADTDHPSAMAAMGVLYETGRGVARSPAQAVDLYVRALETGEVAFDELRQGAPFDWDYDTATAFQEALTQRGVYNNAIDGIVGAGTRRAAEALAGG